MKTCQNCVHYRGEDIPLQPTYTREERCERRRQTVGEILEHSHIQPESDVDTPSLSEADLTFKDLAKGQRVDPP